MTGGSEEALVTGGSEEALVVERRRRPSADFADRDGGGVLQSVGRRGGGGSVAALVERRAPVKADVSRRTRCANGVVLLPTAVPK